MLIAANFPKEIGATVQWLRDQGLALQCFSAAPIIGSTGLFLDVQQIIPGPNDSIYRPAEATQWTLKRPRQPVSKVTAEHRMEFLAYVLRRVRASGLTCFSDTSPSCELWVTAPYRVPAAEFRLVIGQTYAEVDFRICNRKRARNDRIFDHLRVHQEEIEEVFGAQSNWRAPSNWSMRSVALARTFDTSQREMWLAITLFYRARCQVTTRAPAMAAHTEAG